ncbi:MULTISPECIES: TetR/AcrR family transcriptional regulator [Corallincola]|uniref:TetR/AcrR family transcriptional regulator n=2 Tax=Corallincola TaxID=1775176 RepID=A0ABY1WUE8_9GAMM|nr:MULTISPECIES: TetR/AcrR family transcriptional regulator [Corallincola]TAA48349.1 TetR/AcrR family transcriptional regulator [Corallincola spongiicola]TCI02350.1 TetR/AcrR family transcriptional regulator [Corallincola luteus]
MKLTELKHQSIITAAKQEFIEKGFAAANMNKICELAEVSKRTLYKHFESKELLFEAVLTLEQAEHNAQSDYRYLPEQSLQQQLTAITEQEVSKLYRPNGIAFARTVVMELFRQPKTARALSERLYKTPAISQWFAEAITAGAIKPMDVALITSVYESIFNGMFLWSQLLHVAEPVSGNELAIKIQAVVEPVLKTYGQRE